MTDMAFLPLGNLNHVLCSGGVIAIHVKTDLERLSLSVMRLMSLSCSHVVVIDTSRRWWVPCDNCIEPDATAPSCG